MKHLTTLIAALALCACSTGIPLAPYEQAGATPYSFSLCHGFSCTHKTAVTLSDKDWSKIRAHFTPQAKTAAKEREQIAKAIAEIERLTQKNAGLNPDFGQAETFENDQHQMDCIDETINTSRYLTFLEEQKLLKLNRFNPPIHRGYLIDGLWPHNAATVRDIETNEVYVIDSYYSDNGQAVHVVARDIWLNEWRPEELN